MSTSPTKFRYPMRTRVIVVVVLAVAIAGFVVAGLSTDTDDGSGVALSGDGSEAEAGPANGVERRIPGEGDEILGQETIGIDLAPGWTGELLLVSKGTAVQLPSDEVQVTALNELLYQPAEGRTVERLSGDYCLAATIWDQVRGRDASERVETWCFAAT